MTPKHQKNSGLPSYGIYSHLLTLTGQLSSYNIPRTDLDGSTNFEEENER